MGYAPSPSGMNLHIIYTSQAVLLSGRSYASWREIQDEYVDYVASLGPWTEGEVIDFLADDYPNLEPPAEQQVAAFVSGSQLDCALRFQRR